MGKAINMNDSWISESLCYAATNVHKKGAIYGTI